MKSILIIITALFISISVQAQENTSNKKLTRKEKKELKKKEDEKTKKEIRLLIESNKFVFEADQIIDREGNTYAANSNINFISLDSTHVVFQLGSASLIGVNGVGGVTIEGSTSTFKVNHNEKNGYTYIIMKVESKLGFYDIQMDISPLGKTSAKITTSNNKRIGYSGEIVSFKDSRIYQGTTF